MRASRSFVSVGVETGLSGSAPLSDFSGAALVFLESPGFPCEGEDVSVFFWSPGILLRVIYMSFCAWIIIVTVKAISNLTLREWPIGTFLSSTISKF